jgi:hypothetical protein
MLCKILVLVTRRRLSRYKGLLVTILIVTLSFSAPAQVDSTSKILLTFSEQMSKENIFDPANYIVTANENIPVEIIKVGLVKGDSSVVLFFNKEDNWLSYKVTVRNLMDKAGNVISDEKNFAEIKPSFQRNTPVTLLGDK